MQKIVLISNLGLENYVFVFLTNICEYTAINDSLTIKGIILIADFTPLVV